MLEVMSRGFLQCVIMEKMFRFFCCLPTIRIVNKHTFMILLNRSQLAVFYAFKLQKISFRDINKVLSHKLASFLLPAQTKEFPLGRELGKKN